MEVNTAEVFQPQHFNHPDRQRAVRPLPVYPSLKQGGELLYPLVSFVTNQNIG
jgi:hypothetical protein